MIVRVGRSRLVCGCGIADAVVVRRRSVRRGIKLLRDAIFIDVQNYLTVLCP